MKVSIISFTLKGIELSLKIKKAFSGETEEELCLYTKCSHAEKSLTERKLTEKNLAEKELVESGKAVTAEVTFTNSYNDKLVPSYGIVNHFEYDEEADDWTWTQQGIEVVPDVQTN